MITLILIVAIVVSAIVWIISSTLNHNGEMPWEDWQAELHNYFTSDDEIRQEKSDEFYIKLCIVSLIVLCVIAFLISSHLIESSKYIIDNESLFH